MLSLYGYEPSVRKDNLNPLNKRLQSMNIRIVLLVDDVESLFTVSASRSALHVFEGLLEDIWKVSSVSIFLGSAIDIRSSSIPRCIADDALETIYI